MEDAAITNAKGLRNQIVNRLSAIDDERDRLRKRLAEVERFLAQYQAFASGEAIQTLAADESAPARASTQRRARNNSRKEDVAEETRKIIAERGKPIMRTNLYDELIRRGYTIEGTNPEMVLSTMLWRMADRVARLKKGGGYWLPDKPWEPANFTPEGYAEQRLREDEEELNEALSDHINN